MSNKHTPGPWKPVVNNADYWEVVHPWPDQSFEEANSYSPTVVHVCTKNGEEQEANARLIASAPELLEALERLVTEIILSDVDMEYIDSHFMPHIEKARAAITKATGGSA